jgi:molecular chaperone DnaJ
MRTNKRLRVKVPAGIADGQVIRVAGEGEPPRRELSMDGSGVRGDLHAVVRVKEHKDFERDGDDLVMALTIGFSRAALGGVVEVKSIDGPVSIEIPNGSQQGDTVRVDSRGIPNLRSKKRGDLVAVLLLQVPHKLTDRQRQLLEEFAKTEKIEPRKGASKSGFWDKMKDLKDSITGG